MKIGYQGDIGSNNETATETFIKKNSYLKFAKHIEYIPLISSKNVINNLLSGQIDYGVCAVRSFTDKEAIKVEETTEALKETSHMLEALDVLQLPIHHCLFSLPGAKIDTIASHKQALIRTAETRKRLFPDAKEVEERDTAWCAKALRSGELPENYGIICKKETGEKYNLECLLENMEDEPIRTEFMLYKKWSE